MQTIVTPFVHSEDEHSIAGLLSANSISQASTIQHQLKDIFGNSIWLQQQPSVHVTLMEIICDTEYSSKSRKEYFDEWYAAYDATVEEILATTKPFDIEFTELLESKRAIIIKSEKSEHLNNIRSRLLKHISLPPYTKIPPDITHSTLARFSQAIDLDKAQKLTKGLSVNITEHVTEFALMKDLGPPDFNGNPTKIYPLSQV